MKEESRAPENSRFKNDVLEGLTSFPKKLNSKYFYDERGDKLFQKIMDLPEYYLTNLEFEILEQNKKAIAKAFSGKAGFDLIELGAGDGKKTKVLLRHLQKEEYDFKYVPVDISQSVLQQLETSLKEEFPKLQVAPQQGTYEQVLERLKEYDTRKKVILFLGSNLGNLLPEQAVNFLKKINASMKAEDLLFLGLDQKKHPQKILDAYNDSSGVTEAFNKNLLTRINRELEGNFDVDTFLHWPVYNPETGTTKSYLVSKKNQIVQINSLNLEVHFDAWESIHTEISQKYDHHSVTWMARESGMIVSGSFSDNDEYFKNYLFTKHIEHESSLERQDFSRKQ